MGNIGKVLLHDSFRVGITVKGVDGLLEAIAGVALHYIEPSQMGEWLKGLVEHMLIRTPNSHLLIHMLNASQKLSNTNTEFASIYLLTHGLVKAMLVICLWMNRLWAYPLTIMVFAGFMFYQMFRYTSTHSWTLIVLTVFDALIIYLTWVEFRQQQVKRKQAHLAAAQST